MNSDISQTLNGSVLFWNICIFPSKPMECLNRLLTFSLKCFLFVCFSSFDLKNIGSGKPVRLLKMPPKVHIQMWNTRNEAIPLWIIKYLCMFTTCLQLYIFCYIRYSDTGWKQQYDLRDSKAVFIFLLSICITKKITRKLFLCITED